MELTRRSVLAFAPIPAPVQLDLALRHQELAVNPHLTEQAWELMWGPKRPKSADLSVDLLNRELTDGQRHKALSTETRANPLRALLNNNPLTDKDRDILAGKKLPAKLAAELVHNGGFTFEQASKMLQSASVLDRVTWVCTVPSDELDGTVLADVVTDLAAQASSLGVRKLWRACQGLVVTQPEVLDLVFNHTRFEQLVVSAAGSPRLRDPKMQKDLAELMISNPGMYMGLLALIWNPVALPETLELMLSWDRTTTSQNPIVMDVRSAVQRRIDRRPSVTVDPVQVDDDDVLEWMISQRSGYSDPYSGRYTAPKPWHLWYLIQNPNVTRRHIDNVLPVLVRELPYAAVERVAKQIADRLGVDVNDVIGSRYRAHQHAHQDVITDEERNCGPLKVRRFWRNETVIRHVLGHIATGVGDDPAAWDALLVLVDEFDGTVDELIETALAVAS